MKALKDSFLSFKLASMYPSFHAAYLIAFIVEENEYDENCKSKALAYQLLFWIHLLGALQQFVSLVLAKVGFFSLDQLYQQAVSVGYLAIMLFVRTVYVYDEKCSEGEEHWEEYPMIGMENDTFFYQIISTILFLLLANIFEARPGSLLRQFSHPN